MKFIPTKIPDVIRIEPDVYEDGRGFFLESYRKDTFLQNGIRAEFIQDNHSRSAKGVLRGLHYQIPPRQQAKLIRVIRGEAFDVVVDIRKNSKTFGRHVATTLSAGNHQMLFVPAGFAHGFLALKDDTELLYKVTDIYSHEHERGIRWDDAALDIAWPTLGTPYILSDKDKDYPAFQETKF